MKGKTGNGNHGKNGRKNSVLFPVGRQNIAFLNSQHFTFLAADPRHSVFMRRGKISFDEIIFAWIPKKQGNFAIQNPCSMAIRIVHTADNHIGLTFRQYPELSAQLQAERIAALGRIVTFANARQAHFLVIAGDLFDKISVGVTEIRQTVSELKKFQGQAVLVLAGNHDFYDPGTENKLWKEFGNAIREHDQIRMLLQPEILSFECEGEGIRFYACPCPSKHGENPVNSWVSEASKPEGDWHLGIAHGNVEGIGLDADQRYFNMKQQDLKNAGVHTWLLGHIHVPFPEPGFAGTPAFFMSGIHTPDSVKVKHPGNAWLLELDEKKNIRFESFCPGSIRFERLHMELGRVGHNAEYLKKQVNDLASGGLILELVLSGRLPAEEHRSLAAWLEQKSKEFLCISLDSDDLHEEPDLSKLSRHWPEGSLPFDLIQELLAENPQGEDALLAMELLENHRNK
jgi:DNA repair exonuclease SbcCD nuclease subunit